MEIYSQRFGSHKPVWGEKTPRNCFSYARLAAENPKAYFISTVRHGLDVITSKLDENPGKSSHEYHCSVQRYIDSMLCIYSFTNPRHFFVKYEDLVTKTSETLAALFNFLGLPFDPMIINDLNRETISKDLKKVCQPKLNEPVQATWINRWRRPEHKKRIAEFMDRPDAVRWLQHSGYSA